MFLLIIGLVIATLGLSYLFYGVFAHPPTWYEDLPPKNMSRLKSYVFQNGMVMTFDEITGQQVPELQGRYEEVKDKLEAAGADVVRNCDWNEARKAMMQ